MVETEKRLDLGELATFIPNKNTPVYGWFYFKEGYARDLVMLVLDKYTDTINSSSTSAKQSVSVLDPFCGTGTTLLACRERGLDSYGFDVSPLGVLASRAKTNEYDLDELKKAIKEISRTGFEQHPVNDVGRSVRKFFNTHNMEDLLFLREVVDGYEGDVRDFLKLGLIVATEQCSYMHKDGAVLKLRKRKVPMLRRHYFCILRKMLRDLRKARFQPCQTFVDQADARSMRIDTEFIDLVVTSPPYLGKDEYTKIHSIEEHLFFGLPFRKEAKHDFFGLADGGDGREKAYFRDMERLISEFRRVCKPGAVVAMVVGDGCFPDRGKVARMADELPGIAEKQGFDTEKVTILNERWCTRQRVHKIAKMDESLIIMRKR